MAHSGCGPVTGKDDSFRLESENFLPDSLEQQRTVTTRQIPPPHSLPEEHIAADEGFQLGKIKTQAAGAMPGNMQGFHLKSPHPGDRPLVDQQVIGDRLVFDIEAVFFEKRTIPDNCGSIGMKTHPTPMATLDFRGIHHMVKMPVREQQPVDLVL